MSTSCTSVPEGWAWARVKEVGQVKLGRQRSPKYHSGPHMRPYLRVANVYEARIDTSDILEMNFDPVEFERYRLIPGDILLNEGQSLDLVGRPAIYRGEVPGACFQNTLVRFRAFPGMLSQFAIVVFQHYLRSGRFQEIAKWTTNIAHLGAGRFADLEIPVPPLNEQRRIVAKIESLQERSQRARTALEAIPPLLDKFRRSVLAAAFRGDLTADWRAQNSGVEPASVLLERILDERRKRWEQAELEKMKAKGKVPKNDKWKSRYKEPFAPNVEDLPELPEGWCWTTLGAVTFSVIDYRGRTPPKSESGIPLLSSAAIKHDWVKVGASGFVTQETFDQWTTRGLPCAGDLVVTTEAPVGESAIFPADQTYLLSRRVFACQTAISDNRYVMHALYGNHARRHLERFGTRGSTVPRILKPDLLATPVALAPESEQEAVIQRLDRSLGVSRAKSDQMGRTSALLKELDSAVLYRAFKGRLVNQDPNEESASVLLERIGCEGEAAFPVKKGRGRRKKATVGGGTPSKKNSRLLSQPDKA
ncbi:MAG: restriction endonuclease subunit S [Deltaproteobacteria bacterium]|nr:restriction endonuclease subunit S [Deltaproteobacteria bacterium]